MNLRWPILLLFALLLAVTGCSSIPRDIADGPEASPTVSQVQENPVKWLGSPVRWGGSIVTTDNADNLTRIELVSRPLLRNARPSSASDSTDGRFIVEVNGFLDPEIYESGRFLTVVGTLEALKSGKVGNQDYSFPVVEVQSHYLWEKVLPYQYIYPYGYYDPWGSWHRDYRGRYLHPYWTYPDWPHRHPPYPY